MTTKLGTEGAVSVPMPNAMTGGAIRDEQRPRTRHCSNYGNQNGSAKKHSIQKEKAVDIFESIIRFAQSPSVSTYKAQCVK